MSSNARRVTTKVVHVTTVHHPFDTRIFYRECEVLAEAGYDVVLIAPWHESLMRNHIRIRAIRMQDSRLARLILGSWHAYWAARDEDAALYHLHDPELIGLGLLLRLQGYPVIYDVHEDLPNQILGKYWISSWCKPTLQRISTFAETFAGWLMSYIVAATPTIAARFPFHKTKTIFNFPISDELVVVDSPKVYSERSYEVSYIGGISPQRGVYEMITAVKVLAEKDIAIKLNLVGPCHPEQLQSQLAQLTTELSVILWGRQDRPFVSEILSRSRIGLVTLHPTQSYLDSFPIKLFEYMSAGLPVIASDFPIWRDIIEQAQCGLLVNPLDPNEIAQAIYWLLTHSDEAEAMGKRGREATLNRYNWESEGQKLINLYQEILGSNNHSTPTMR